jgi:hypothetical protein
MEAHMRWYVGVLVLILSACSPGYTWKIPPESEPHFRFDRYECDRNALGAYPKTLPAAAGVKPEDTDAMQEALFKRCMQEKGYQLVE